DPDGNGFYQTGRDAEQLVVRPRELFDNAIPAGSSVAADVLQRLGRLTATPAWEQSGLTALHPVLGVLARAATGFGHAPPPLAALARAPTGFGHALGAADFALSRVREVAIVGPPQAEETRTLLTKVGSTDREGGVE